jgi:hypothetical protein
MAYHAPRVLYWAEQAGVRFFPTPYLNQIMLQPFAEYVDLQTYLLSGSDHFFNLTQWFASFSCMVAVWAIAGELGANALGRVFAAFLAATLPLGILASSGAKNDYVLAMWIAAAAFFALRWRSTRIPADAWRMGAALGLALLTKATGYLYAPWILAAILVRPALSGFRKTVVPLAGALAIAFAINAPFFARNLDLSGSPFGFDSAQADGVYRWRNESFGLKQTASNLLRNASDALGARSSTWNQAIYRIVLNGHRALGISPDDPATTWRGTTFAPPRNGNHEADAPSPWHAAAIFLSALLCCFAAVRRGPRLPAAYVLALAGGFVSFCFYLKWQPYMGRLLLPLFILGAPLTGLAASWTWPFMRGKPLVLAVLGVFFLSGARLRVLDNWVRPLKGPESILRRPRESQYFADMHQFGALEVPYRAARDLLARSGCRTVGIDINQFQLEYPLQALLRDARPDVRFVHTGVDNPSRKYAPPVAEEPCAVVCLQCAGDPARMTRYSGFGLESTVGEIGVWIR